MSTEEPLDGAIDLTNGGSSVRSLRVNGNGHSNGNGAAVVPEPSITSAAHDELSSVEWFPAYDRETVARYLSSLDEERARLEAEIAEAERRTAAANEALAARTAEVEAALGAVVLAARAELDRIEREQHAAVAAIRAGAEAEAARIRQAARLEAETVHEAASSLSTLAWPEPAPSPFPGVTRPSDAQMTWPAPTEGWTDAG